MEHIRVGGLPPVSLRSPGRRRGALRRNVQVACEAVADDGFRLLGERVLDLSPRGMLLETRGAFARLGEEVIVSFRPPRSRMWVDAQARVARIVSGRRRGDRAQAVGLSFVEMGAGDRAFLTAKLRGYPPPIPARPRAVDYATAVASIAGL